MKARALYERLKREGEAAGYFLNPDVDFVLDLMAGLLANQERYGYPSCPCRLADGVREKDLEIICPCDYRDQDLDEYGMCYCALYVSAEVAVGSKDVEPIPDRRGEAAVVHEDEFAGWTPEGIPVWRCRVCGYLCARSRPPLKCPICKADGDRFARFA